LSCKGVKSPTKKERERFPLSLQSHRDKKLCQEKKKKKRGGARFLSNCRPTDTRTEKKKDQTPCTLPMKPSPSMCSQKEKGRVFGDVARSSRISRWNWRIWRGEGDSRRQFAFAGRKIGKKWSTISIQRRPPEGSGKGEKQRLAPFVRKEKGTLGKRHDP